MQVQQLIEYKVEQQVKHKERMRKHGAKVAKLAGDQMLDYNTWSAKDHYGWTGPGYSRHHHQAPYNHMYGGYANPYRNLRHADGVLPSFSRDLADSSYYSAAAAMANASPRNRHAAKMDVM